MSQKVLYLSKFVVRLATDSELQFVSFRGEWLDDRSLRFGQRERNTLLGSGGQGDRFRNCLHRPPGTGGSWKLSDRRSHIRSRLQSRNNLFDFTLALVGGFAKNFFMIRLGQVRC